MNVLYIFISHQKGIQDERIKQVMQDTGNYLIIKGGYSKNEYDKDKQLLKIKCNDFYEGLPEKVLKTYKFIVESPEFDKYKFFIKVDDDMLIIKKLNNLPYKHNYIGFVERPPGSRTWHINRCSKNSHWNHTPYKGKFTPWCLGGLGYILSRKAIQAIKDDQRYLQHIYEDVYISLLLREKNIRPVHFKNIKNFMRSPDHILYY